jgi:hypothetical protein
VRAEPTLTMWVWDENWAEIIGNGLPMTATRGAEVDCGQPWQQYWDLCAPTRRAVNSPTYQHVAVRFFFYASNVLCSISTLFR